MSKTTLFSPERLEKIKEITELLSGKDERLEQNLKRVVGTFFLFHEEFEMLKYIVKISPRYRENQQFYAQATRNLIKEELEVLEKEFEMKGL